MVFMLAPGTALMAAWKAVSAVIGLAPGVGGKDLGGVSAAGCPVRPCSGVVRAVRLQMEGEDCLGTDYFSQL